MSKYPRVRFLKSADSPAGFGDDSGSEIAFAGRSNSGKSSALNAIVERDALARTSRTPGRTRLVNLFELEPGRRLVDLPGYGYARVPPSMRAEWEKLMEAYFATRDSLAGLVLVVDARRGIADSDRIMLEFAASRGCLVHVLLTKADKLGRNDARAALKDARAALAGRADAQLFSAETGEGVDTAQGAVSAMLAGRAKKAPGDP